MHFREGRRLTRRNSRIFAVYFALSVVAAFSIWYISAWLCQILEMLLDKQVREAIEESSRLWLNTPIAFSVLVISIAVLWILLSAFSIWTWIMQPISQQSFCAIFSYDTLKK
jgi:small-conductance mechanosensitive channel